MDGKIIEYKEGWNGLFLGAKFVSILVFSSFSMCLNHIIVNISF